MPGFNSEMNETPTKLIASPLIEAIREAYRRGEEDETLEPIILCDKKGNPIGRIGEGDSVIFYDIRGEREIELTRSLVDEDFPYFPRSKKLNLCFVTMIEYHPSLGVRVAFLPDGKIQNTLTETVTRCGLRVAKIAESEKASHIGFFFNGKSEEIFPGEERFIIPSPHGVANYAEVPEMSASLVAEEVIARLRDSRFPLIIANLANVDVVGHIENKRAVLKAVETVDGELGRIVEACRASKTALVVTSDHGTVEEWHYQDGTVNTGHTKNPVPFILADFSAEDPNSLTLRGYGELADVAPTILDLFSLKKPSAMSGQSLLLDTQVKKARNKILFLILDGWGMRGEKEGNLIAEALTPNFDKIWEEFPHALLKASGEAVGMPSHTVGNSEAGHLHLGAGRRVLLDRVRIDNAIEEGSFFKNKAFLWAMEEARRNNKPLHLMGIVSHYSSHGTLKHLFPLLQLAKVQGSEEVYIHAFIGRRGEKPESGALYVSKVEGMCRELSLGQVVTVMGRHWSLDREGNWERIEKAYRALVHGDGVKAYRI